MSIPMLVVDTDLEVHQRESIAWREHGIPTVRVDTMCEAMEELKTDIYLFIAINGDSVNYMPMLKVLSDVSNVPVLIFKACVSIYEQVEAMHTGADACVEFQALPSENIMLALALVDKYNSINPVKRPHFFSYGKLIVFSHRRQVYCGNDEIQFTKMEFDTLLYLCHNRGNVLTYNSIIRKVWGMEYINTTRSSLGTHMSKLRKKIEAATGDGYIINVREVGYKLPAYMSI